MKMRVADEATYVLAVLYQMRDRVVANPEMFGPNALKFIQEAIAHNETVVKTLKVLAPHKDFDDGDGSSWENDSVK